MDMLNQCIFELLVTKNIKKQKNKKILLLLTKFECYLFPEWYETRPKFGEGLFQFFKKILPKIRCKFV